jgi:hypothetical protein
MERRHEAQGEIAMATWISLSHTGPLQVSHVERSLVVYGVPDDRQQKCTARNHGSRYHLGSVRQMTVSIAFFLRH